LRKIKILCTLRAANKKERIMKAFAVIVGIVLCLVLYFGVGYLIFSYADKFLHDSGDSLGLLLSLVVYMPVILFFGSISTGFIIEPEMEERSYLALIFYSPGFYFAGLFAMFGLASVFLDSVNSFFTNNRASTPAAPGAYWGCFMAALIPILWHAASWAGTALGYKVRAKLSGDD